MPFRRGFNCCNFNHPCPICCPFLRCCDDTVIVNPILTGNFGFFNNLSVGSIPTQAIIPLSFVDGQGTSTLSSTTTIGAIIVAPGTYSVSYFAGGTVPTGENLSIKLRLNGSDIAGSIISTSQTVGNTASLTQTIVFTVMQTSTLELVNNSSATTTYTTASLYIRKL